MKKKLIAGASVAAFAVAAVPALGVFAATSGSFTDVITVNVPDSCTIETDATQDDGEYENRTFNVEIPAGSYLEFGNSDVSGSEDATMTVKCNVPTTSTATWTLTAVAANGGSLEGTGSADGESINSGAAAESGDTSSWAMKVVVSAGTATNHFSDYEAVPIALAGEEVLTASAVSAGAANNVTFRPQYKVYVQPDQAPGDYEGSVTYTVAVDD